MVTFASKPKCHDDKGRIRSGDCLLRREQDQLQTAFSELGVASSFYEAKRKYAPKEDDENAGEFLQLVPGGAFLPNNLIKSSQSRSSKQKDLAQSSGAVSIEFRTPTGTMMRISDNLTDQP